MPMASCGWTRPCPSARPDSPVRCSTSSCEISIPADKPCWFMRPLRCTSSAWLGLIVFSEFLDRRLKVCCGHAELFVVLALLFMNQVGNGQHRRPLAQEGDVGPDQPFRNACQHAKIHVAAQRPPVGVDAEYFESFPLIRDIKLENIIEPAGPYQGRVKQVFPIGSPDPDHLREIAQRVQLVEKLACHAFNGSGSRIFTAFWRQGIDFVEKEDGRSRLLGFLEYPVQRLFRFPQALLKKDGTADRDKINT